MENKSDVIFVKYVLETNSKTIGNFENPKWITNRYSNVLVDDSFYGKIKVMKK